MSARPIIIATILFFGFFAYTNALLNDFVWDDEEQIVKNDTIKDPKNLPAIFSSSTFYAGGAGLSGGFYRPLVNLFYLANYQIWGLNPFGYHLIQTLFHLLNLLLLFFLLERILDDQTVLSAPCRGNRGIKDSEIVAGLAVLLFAVHPANVESVAYAGCAGEVLYLFFVLLGLNILARGRGKDGSFENKHLFAFFFLVFAGLLAKESAIAAFPIAFVYLLFFVRPGSAAYGRFFAGSLIATAVYAFLRFFIAKIPLASANFSPIAEATFFERLLTIPYSVITYLKIIFFPLDLSISRHFVIVSAADTRFWLPVLVLAAIFGAAGYFFYKKKAIVPAFFALWFIIALVPALNILPVSMTAAERWLYLPLAGAAALASMLVVPAIQKTPKNRRYASYVVLSLILISLFARTISRNGDWKNGLTLYSRDIKIVERVSPQGSFDLENNYGVELFRAGRIEEAEEHFRKSIALQSGWAISQNNLGVALERKGDLEGALIQYEKSMETGDYYLAYENKAGILLKLGRHDENKKFLESSLLKFPQNNKLKLYLAWLYAAEDTAPDIGEREKAMILLAQILNAEPQNEPARRLYLAIREGEEIQ